MKKLINDHKREIIIIFSCVIGSLLLAWYVSVFTMFAREARKIIWNPASFGRYVRYYGFPSKTFWIRDIKDGIIITKDGRFVKVMEFSAINFIRSLRQSSFCQAEHNGKSFQRRQIHQTLSNALQAR